MAAPHGSRSCGGSGQRAAQGAVALVAPGPCSAWFSVDRRSNPEEELQPELDRLTGMIDRTAERIGVRVEIDVPQGQPPAAPPRAPRRPGARPLRRRDRGAEPAFRLCPGVLDPRWYSQLGIPAFAYGGGRVDLSHGPDGYIDETAMRSCAAVHALFAAAVA